MNHDLSFFAIKSMNRISFPTLRLMTPIQVFEIEFLSFVYTCSIPKSGVLYAFITCKENWKLTANLPVWMLANLVISNGG